MSIGFKRKIYYAGDFKSNTGPAIVNKSYYPYVKNYFYICRNNSKIFRLIHFTAYVLFSRAIIVSSISIFHIKIIRIGNLLGLPTFYLMHGYIKLESELNELTDIKSKIAAERELLSMVGTIICVSELFCNYLKTELPDLAYKIKFVNNGVNLSESQRSPKDKTSNVYNIISVGGGMPIKNILQVCTAIHQINNSAIKFTVIGPKYIYGDVIEQYPFVKYIENTTYPNVQSLMRKSDLYIQNSSFETFGLAVCEAIIANCQILISEKIGAISIIKGLKDNNLIHNVNDKDEISHKISYLYNHRYRSKNPTFDKGNSWEDSAKKLLMTISCANSLNAIDKGKSNA